MLIFTGTWLRKKREQLGLSQAQFARCVGGWQDAVMNMEAGNLVLDFPLIQRIYIFLEEHFEIEELCSEHMDLIEELRNQRFILGEERLIYVGYRLIAYEDFQDFYDFDGFILRDEDFWSRRRQGYFGTGTIVYERWIQTDIVTATHIFELQQGILSQN
jgi:transcriptional regulator with XRE-family HTH domain